MNRHSEVSVVIPVLNRSAELADSLRALPEVGEVIVVDGGSSDGSAETAARHGARVVTSAPGRGKQLRAGAEQASCRWLLFLHADTRLDPAAWSSISRMVAREDTNRAGFFRFALDDPAWQARLIERGVGLRVALLALPYGDQGLLIHRSLYEEIDGYRDMPLMEDVDLVRRLGRTRLVRLAGTATTSAERWRGRGWARQSVSNLKCLLLYLLGAPAERIAAIRGR
jgi:rSAM/selenodomain-associated transferase 2